MEMHVSREFQKLHALGALGGVEFLDSPYDIFSLVRAHSAPTMTKNILKVRCPNFHQAPPSNT